MMLLNKYERCTFQVKTRYGCLYVNVSEGNRLSSEMCRWHFYLILPIMPDKQRLCARTVQLCVLETVILSCS